MENILNDDSQINAIQEVGNDNTSFGEVFELFLAQIDDYEIGSIGSVEDASLYMEKYLINSLPSLQNAINDLTDIDFENKRFGFKLSFVEKALVAKAMKLEWVREKRFSLDLMRKSIGDRDFKAVQGTDYLKQLGIMEKQLRYEIRDEIIRHSYSKDEYWSALKR